MKGKAKFREKVSLYSPLEKLQVIGRTKQRYRQTVPERNGSTEMMVGSCIRSLDGIRMGMVRSSGQRGRERARHAVSKF